jgi:hypothetical protein
MKKHYTSLFLFVCIQVSGQRTSKNYFKNGKESEGWLNQNQKMNYWFNYYERAAIRRKKDITSKKNKQVGFINQITIDKK